MQMRGLLAVLGLATATATATTMAMAMAGFAADAVQTDLPQRQQVQRADLATSSDMEVVTSIVEIKPGEGIARHYHHGTETGYVLQGSMVQFPGKAPTLMRTGDTFMTPRDLPHAGFTVVGEKSLKLLTVHVVDKHQALYEWVN